MPLVKFADGEGRQFDPSSNVWFDGKSQCWSGKEQFTFKSDDWSYGKKEWAESNGAWKVASGDAPELVSCESVPSFAAKANAFAAKAVPQASKKAESADKGMTSQPTPATPAPAKIKTAESDSSGRAEAGDDAGIDRMQEVLRQRRPNDHRAVRRREQQSELTTTSWGTSVMTMSAATAKSIAPARVARVGKRRKAVPMIPKLAYRNLFHDRLSLIVTLTGIVFSVVLVAVQFGLYLGSENRIAAMLDNAKADLWVVPSAPKALTIPRFFSGRERHAILSTPGVASAEELVVGFASWRKPRGGSTAALLVGSKHSQRACCLGISSEGRMADLASPNGSLSIRPISTSSA